MSIKRKRSGPTSVTLDIAYSLHGGSGHWKAPRLTSSSVEQVFETNKREVSRGRNIGGISHIERLLSVCRKGFILGKIWSRQCCQGQRDLQDRNTLSGSFLRRLRLSQEALLLYTPHFPWVANSFPYVHTLEGIPFGKHMLQSLKPF